mmetsp:Transcript_8861/g.14748  ORF Transcript_8861/g.14748 Transcript_8861/m.14748 type:complete len:95 (-) Transcript_8861:86-370(-)|eukprot:CAMPEP_0119003530 /NCGR_PEP_ID=MMETSP1176-20130426/617_1 /TAXON_ID=265551 /ORGANISM="Synedropsis recta cf, Strain CCMP1620" /LENGTH=94 /DNA_ID=CAMNT_0006955141 /DNA_START=63 /DNA_END=347 /DNA_ORIENTATION=-
MDDEFGTMATLNAYFDHTGRVKNSWGAIKEHIGQLKREKRKSEEYIQALEIKVKALTLENHEMKDQVNAKKQMIQQAKSELGAESSYFCGVGLY